MINVRKVFLIRHGEALHNIKLFGKDTYFDKKNLDSPLTAVGISQAKTLGNTWLYKNNIDLILVSPLTRTLQTATNIFPENNIPMIALDSIKEYPQGKHTPNIRKTKKELKSLWKNIDFDLIEKNDSFIGKKETEEQLNNRVQDVKNYIIAINKKNIAIVSHSSFINCFFGKELEKEDSYGTISHCFPYKFEI